MQKTANSNRDLIVEAQNFFRGAEDALANRDVQRAIAFYDRAEAAGWNADACAGARWLCHMLNGDFELAWRESDAIAARGNPDPNRFWNREPLEGKRVLVRCLHGLGDTLQYVRYLPLLRERCARVVLEAQPCLKNFLNCCDVADEVITWGEPEPIWDSQIEVVELPLIFRSTVRTIPAKIPYLKTSPKKTTAPESRVGLMWRSSTYNPNRSIPFQLMEELAHEITRARLFSFQPEPEPLPDSIVDASPASANICETANRLCEMDLVITVDTMLAHLAGGLGLRVWLLLPFAADWRWMIDRSDSPWYPTMRLFRQPKPGDWQSVIEQVKHCWTHARPD